MAALEGHLKSTVGDSLLDQSPKGLARRLFVELSKFTHGAAGFTDGDSRQSNGPVFLAERFLRWYVAALKIYALALQELKLAHPQLEDLPWGPPPLTVDTFRVKVFTDMPSSDKDQGLLQALLDFAPE